MSSKSKKAIAGLLLALATALALSFSPQLSPVCAAIDPELVEDALDDGSSSEGGEAPPDLGSDTSGDLSPADGSSSSEGGESSDGGGSSSGA